MEKMMRISKKLDTFFKVVQKLVLIGMGVAIIAAAVVTAANGMYPDAVIGEGFQSVEIGSVTIELAAELAPDNGRILGYLWSVIALGAASAAFLYYACGIVRKVLAPMTEGRPFDSSVGQNIKKIGYISLMLGLVQNVASMVQTAAAVRTFELAALADSGAVKSITANYTFDLSFLIVFFVLLLMAHIFNYGAELQQLSDETL